MFDPDVATLVFVGLVDAFVHVDYEDDFSIDIHGFGLKVNRWPYAVVGHITNVTADLLDFIVCEANDFAGLVLYADENVSSSIVGEGNNLCGDF